MTDKKEGNEVKPDEEVLCVGDDEKFIEILSNQYDSILEEAVEHILIENKPWPMIYELWDTDIKVEITEKEFHMIGKAYKFYIT